MQVEQSLDAEAVCACGCGEPVTPGRAYVHGHNRRKGPQPAERVCARPGCEERFRPTAQAVEHGHGRYCSKACNDEDHRADERVCPTCGETFRPLASAVTRGKGRYCSIECRRTGELVACLECGAETYRNRADVERGSRFCSWSCWMRHRWREDSDELRLRLADAMRHRWHTGLGLESLIERQGGKARRVWKLRWTRSPGAPRSYTDEQAAWVLSLAARGYGHRRIAETVGLHRDTVRRIRCPEKRA
jgi:hypothetical protein